MTDDEEWKAIAEQKVTSLEGRVEQLERQVRDMKLVVDLLHSRQR
ncbi:hypothetical protein [Mycolicibacterium sp.]